MLISNWAPAPRMTVCAVLDQDRGGRHIAAALKALIHARAGDVRLLKKIFTWWDGATLGALFDIRRRGQFVGEDDTGNRYYEERKPSLEGRKRRWVIYPGYPEASNVPPMWHSWLAYTVDETPGDGDAAPRTWEKPHQPNLTGTPGAYRPKGSLGRDGERPAATGDYEAWTPERRG
jgi:NADH:ubiquinone oxidoreductase subunit